MLFSSYVFVFAFLPVTLMGWFALSHLKNPYPQRIFLAGASLFFYSYFNLKYALIILSSIAVNYALAYISIKSISVALKKPLLGLAVAFNVLLLGYYKYYDFFIGSINTIASTEFTLRNILLPLGISFFTFQQLLFQLKIYRDRVEDMNLINYIVFISFFPQLIAGPIVEYTELIPQVTNLKLRRFNIENFSQGLFAFTIGLFKKVLLADTLSTLVDNGFALGDTPGLLSAWAVMFAYSFQLYFDFSGYSDMAIGLGKMFNWDLPVNFDLPYRSASIGEFWKRWHMTLGRSLREFVYIPLGGSRRGKAIKCINLFITFLVSGIWHGASWTFVVWGAAHGAARVSEELLEKPLSKIPRALRTAATFLFVCAAFVLFRAESFTEAATIYKGLFNVSSLGFMQLKSLVYDGIIGVPSNVAAVIVFAMLLVCFLLVFKSRCSVELTRSFKPTPAYGVACAVMFILSVICMSRSTVFIYFNF